MEDYEEFVQLRLSQLRKSEDSKPPASSASRDKNGLSLIRFYGQPILPPLLSEKQRDEMRGHRDAVQKAAVQRKLKADARVAYIQTVLNSVQLRNTPTLEEFFQESGLNTSKSLYPCDATSGSVSSSDYVTGTKDFLLSPPSDLHDGKAGVCIPPLTSTTYSAFSTYYQEECLIDQNEEQLGLQPKTDPFNGSSCQSLTSGYVTYDNDKNTTSVFGMIEEESHGFCSLEGTNDTGGFFLHNTSNTITKMPDIISHPPIDGEELEKSALASSLYNNFITGLSPEGICSTSVQQDSVISTYSAEQVPSDGHEGRHLSTGEFDCTHLESTQCEDNPPFSAVDLLGQDQYQDGNEGPVPGDPELLQTLPTHHCSTTNQSQIKHGLRETEAADNQECETNLNPPEEPYHLSLQALLKKSQEYRRRQRMLRNQAKNSKIQERTQERPRVGEEEQSLSDKENDEFPYKGTVTAEGKKTREKAGTVFLSMEISQRISWENEQRREGILIKDNHGKKAKSGSESTCLAGDGNTETLARVQGEPAFSNNHPNYSQEAITDPKQTGTFSEPLPVILTDNSPIQEAFYLTSEQSTTCPLSGSKGVGRYQTVPAPLFCLSPIRSKGKGSVKPGEVIDGADAQKTKVLINTGLNVDNKVESERNFGHENIRCPAVSPTTHLVGEGDVSRVLPKCSAQAQHIDQLQKNLSCLKVLISDLESTLTENVENHSQADCSLHSDFSHEGTEQSAQMKNDPHVQSGQNDCDYWEDRPMDDYDRNDTEQDERDSEWQRRQLLDNYKNKHEETGHEPNIVDPKVLPLIVEERGTEAVNAREVSLVTTSTTETGKVIGTGKGGQSALGVAPCRVWWSDKASLPKNLNIMSYGQHEDCKKQPPAAKCITSQAQRMRIPDVFRKVPSETAVPRKGLVLSDASNQPKERRTEMAVEGEDSSHFPSLNQSYDVDTPSGLWLLEGSGSNLSSKGHHDQEQDLTPESGGEGQGEGSKVKRRLLMHEHRNGDTSDGADLVVRPNSSTPKASLRWHEGHSGQRDKQQQLKQAHAAQVRALQEEHKRQQEELLQALALRYRLLQSVSFPCPMSSSRLGDTLTSLTFPQPSSSLPERYRPLVLAAVKGFLTRRLLRTERVAQLLRTIRDTQQFLQAFQQQTPGRGEFCSRQDLLLQERVTLQLRSARYEVYDIFFSLSAGERMQLISWDRELARERELRRQSGHSGVSKGKSSLSAATQKSLDRKRGIMIQKKAAERHRCAATRAAHRAGFIAEQPLETKRGQFRANPQRVPKTANSSRPR